MRTGFRLIVACVAWSSLLAAQPAITGQGVPARMIQYAGQPHGISGHWNNVHRMLNELKWFDTYMKKT